MKTKRAKWEVIGAISVDSGCITIADPCYDVDDSLYIEAETDTVCHPHEGDTLELKRGFGAAVTLSTGLGDGVYLVEAKRCIEGGFEGRIKEVRIKFF